MFFYSYIEVGPNKLILEIYLNLLLNNLKPKNRNIIKFIIK